MSPDLRCFGLNDLGRLAGEDPAEAFFLVRLLATTAEAGYSETAFVTVADQAARRFRLRFFSPLAEVAFCGHATVATTVALAERIGPQGLRDGDAHQRSHPLPLPATPSRWEVSSRTRPPVIRR